MQKPLQKMYRKITILLLLVAFVGMSAILYSFSSKINVPQAELGRARLREVTAQNVNFVRLAVEDKMVFAKSVASDLRNVEDLRAPENIAHLARLCEQSNFERLAIDFLDGKSYTSDGYVVDYSDMGYIDDILLGEPFITPLFAAKIDGKPCISVIVPIVRAGEVIAAVRGTIYTQSFGQMLGVKVFEGEGYFHLLNTKGEYLAISDSPNAFLMDENYFDALPKLHFDKGFSADRLNKDMAAGLAGSTAYAFEGNERYVEYMPVGINDWYLMIIVPKWVIDKNAAAIQQEVLLLVIQLSAIAFAVFFFILFTMKSAQNEIKKINANLAIGEKRYRFMLERSDNIIFEYTLKDGKIEYSEKFEKHFGYPPTKQGLPMSIIQNRQIHEEDGHALLELFEDVKAGKKSAQTELRIRQKDGSYLWCAIAAVTIFAEDGHPIKALGVIENIDQKKRRELALITKAEKDQLTGLYNKTTTENLIRDFLNCIGNRSGSHALMIIDIDNFKDVNDKLGHYCGDMVLTELAHELKPALRDADVVGRIGGDEFFVFMKHISAQEVAVHKANEICSLFHRTYQEKGVSCTISASIGIAIYPAYGEDFETLYKNADMALYTVKANGKSGCSVFSGGSIPNYISHRTEIVSAGSAMPEQGADPPSQAEEPPTAYNSFTFQQNTPEKP